MLNDKIKAYHSCLWCLFSRYCLLLWDLNIWLWIRHLILVQFCVIETHIFNIIDGQENALALNVWSFDWKSISSACISLVYFPLNIELIFFILLGGLHTQVLLSCLQRAFFAHFYVFLVLVLHCNHVT